MSDNQAFLAMVNDWQRHWGAVPFTPTPTVYRATDDSGATQTLLPLPPHHRICPYCGQSASSDWLYCGQGETWGCGAPLVQISGVSASEYRASLTTKQAGEAMMELGRAMGNNLSRGAK